MLELETPDIYGANYGQVFKGYFYAPNSGDYIFRSVHDDSVQLYVSSVYGSAELDPTAHISSNTHSGSSNFYYNNYPAALGAPLTLVQGQYYYMELYHVNGGGAGYMRMSVQVPNTNADLKHQTHEVIHFETQVTYDP